MDNHNHIRSTQPNYMNHHSYMDLNHKRPHLLLPNIRNKWGPKMKVRHPSPMMNNRILIHHIRHEHKHPHSGMDLSHKHLWISNQQRFLHSVWIIKKFDNYVILMKDTAYTLFACIPYKTTWTVTRRSSSNIRTITTICTVEIITTSFVN